MTKTLIYILFFLPTIVFGQNLFSSKTFKNYKYISKRDTLTIIDTLTSKASSQYIQWFSYILSINKYGVLRARVADGYMLLNYQGKVLNGPFTYFSESENGFILTGPKWGQDRDYLVFSSKGDTVLTIDEAIGFYHRLGDTLTIPAYNLKTKRKEIGVLTKNGWLTKEYMDKNGNWTKPTIK